MPDSGWRGRFKKRELGPSLKKVIDLIDEEPFLTPAEIASRTKVSQATVSRAVRAGVDRGVIKMSRPRGQAAWTYSMVDVSLPEGHVHRTIEPATSAVSPLPYGGDYRKRRSYEFLMREIGREGKDRRELLKTHTPHSLGKMLAVLHDLDLVKERVFLTDKAIQALWPTNLDGMMNGLSSYGPSWPPARYEDAYEAALNIEALLSQERKKWLQRLPDLKSTWAPTRKAEITARRILKSFEADDPSTACRLLPRFQRDLGTGTFPIRMWPVPELEGRQILDRIDQLFDRLDDECDRLGFGQPLSDLEFLNLGPRTSAVTVSLGVGAVGAWLARRYAVESGTAALGTGAAIGILSLVLMGRP